SGVGYGYPQRNHRSVAVAELRLPVGGDAGSDVSLADLVSNRPGRRSLCTDLCAGGAILAGAQLIHFFSADCRTPSAISTHPRVDIPQGGCGASAGMV